MPIPGKHVDIVAKIVRLGDVRIIGLLLARHEATLDAGSRVREAFTTVVLDLLAPDTLLLLVAESVDSNLAFLFAVGADTSLCGEHFDDGRLESVTEFTRLLWLVDLRFHHFGLNSELNSRRRLGVGVDEEGQEDRGVTQRVTSAAEGVGELGE